MRRKEPNEIINNMADITDVQLISELKQFGETVQVPIKANKRPILLKKLNHLRARAKANEVSPTKSKSKQGSRQVTASSSTVNTKYGNNINNSPEKSSFFKINNSQSYHNYEDKSVPKSSRLYGLPRLDTLSSDDSDVETAPKSKTSRPTSPVTGPSIGANHANSSLREKSRISNVSDNVLRTLRRRTGELPELPPRRTRQSEVHELSGERRSYENLTTDTPETSPVPSPARSRLYPNLANLYPNANDDTFESSDSDHEGSTYLVTNKSVNTSFQSYTSDNHDDNGRDLSEISFGRGSTLKKTPSANDSPSIHHRNVSGFPQQRYSYGPHRVQQYKSRYLENLPHILVAIVIIFFVGLSLTYVVIHKDYFFSWFSSPDYMVSKGEKLKCTKTQDDDEEYKEKEIAASLQTLKTWFAHLSQRKGEVLCYDKTGVEAVNVAELKNLINTSNDRDAGRIFTCSMELILANPQWHIRALKDDGSSASAISEISKLESSVADMTVWCRLKRSFVYVLYVIFIVIAAIGAVLLLSMFIKYKIRQYEAERKAVYDMVDKIIDYLQEHYDRSKKEGVEDPPFLAVQLVRDHLLPPATRQQEIPIWNKAVDFIVANESRIQMSTSIISGEEFSVWHWLPPTSTNEKIWQGQAFGENSENNSSQIIYSPTPCLKIRNMFDSNVESGENWERNVTDAILEKCETIRNIVHVYVDVESREGCVYLKCSTCEAAGQARQALHGWWFDGRLVTVKFLRTDHYHKRWPESRNATLPLKPSTNQMRSLSQPYYRSSLEMT